MQREAEGFLLPLVSTDAEELLEGFFKRYNCWPPYREGWMEAKTDLTELQTMLNRFSILIRSDSGLTITKDEAIFFFDMLNIHPISHVHRPLELDLDRLHELEEGWIPVKTLLGDGILAFENCE